MSNGEIRLEIDEQIASTTGSPTHCGGATGFSMWGELSEEKA